MGKRPHEATSLTQNNKRMSNRLIANLLSAWKGLSSPFAGNRLELSAYLHEEEVTPLQEKIKACLESKGGQVSARARAAELGKAYLNLNDEGKAKYLTILAKEFGIDHDRIRITAESLFTDIPATERVAIERRLRKQLTPPYLTLLTQFNALPNGLKFLVDMRSDLIRLKRDYPELAGVEEELKIQLSSWFDIGFLDLKRIDWNAPASLLEKLIAYESVHRVESWYDLHHRLAENRRCFAFFHPRMPDEPLIFVWVALVDELSDNVGTLLDISQSETIADTDDTAIFYSINSTQSGLAGVSLGDFLIKRVTDELRRELPQLKRFSTLSPLPGFSTWLADQLENTEDARLFSSEQRSTVAEHSDTAIEALLQSGDWHQQEEISAVMQDILMPLAARYIVEEKRTGHRALDSVAHFHLSNGARVERINWRGDVSERGKSQSYSMMVNYLYDLEDIETNHEQYIENGTIATAKDVNALLPENAEQ
jgi:malonyl-CoA decarboxylase